MSPKLVSAFERAVAAELARSGPISGDAFRLIRKALDMGPRDVAELLGVRGERVAAWEENRRAVDIAAWTVLSMVLLDTVEGPRPIRGRMRKQRAARSVATVRVQLDPTQPKTIGRALRLLASPAVLSEDDVADALDVDVATLRAQLAAGDGVGADAPLRTSSSPPARAVAKTIRNTRAKSQSDRNQAPTPSTATQAFVGVSMENRAGPITNSGRTRERPSPVPIRRRSAGSPRQLHTVT